MPTSLVTSTLVTQIQAQVSTLSRYERGIQSEISAGEFCFGDVEFQEGSPGGYPFRN